MVEVTVARCQAPGMKLSPPRCRVSLLLLLMFASACIESARQTGDRDSQSEASGDSGDTAGPDTDTGSDEVDPPDTVADVPDTVADVTDTAVDTHDTTPDDTNVVEVDAAEVISRPCLPAGCAEPGVGCGLREGFCYIDGACIDDEALKPDNTCKRCDAGLSPRQWLSLEDGDGCDDGLSCTDHDACRAGVCKGETDCPSTLACATPRCDAALDACVNVIDRDRCLVGDLCMSAGQLSADLCGACRPDVAQDRLTAGDGNEPDDDFDTANPVPFDDTKVVTHASDSDPGWNGPWTSSTLSPAFDIDAFGFVYSSPAGFYRPLMRVTRADALALEACIYIRCLPEVGQLTRPVASAVCAGSDTKKTDGDWVGCCRQSVNLSVELAASQNWCERAGVKVVTDAEAVMTVRRVLPPAQPACYPYSLKWGVK